MKSLAITVFFLFGILYGLSAQSGSDCNSPFDITSIPYTVTNYTTEGMGNDYSSADACGSQFMNGEDIVFRFVPTDDVLADVNVTGTGYFTGLFILDGCPDDTSSNCLYSQEAYAGNPALNNVQFFQNQTYYIIISTYNFMGQYPFTSFNLDIIPVYPYDAAVISVNSPSSGYNLSSGEIVSAVIENTGQNEISELIASYYLGNVLMCEDTITDTIASGLSIVHSFSQSADLSAYGDYEISVKIETMWDSNASNDSLFSVISNIDPPIGAICSEPEIIPSLPFNALGLTTSDHGNDYNSAQVCNGSNISGNDYVLEFTPDSSMYISIVLDNAMGTNNLLLGYLGSVGLYLLDGCPDDTATSCIAMSESAFQEGNPAIYAASVDSAQTYYILVSTAGMGGQNESTDFDIYVNQALIVDMALQAIVSPVTGFELSANEAVEISLINMGLDTLSGFNVQYSVSGGSPVIELISDTIVPGASFNYIFNNAANLSVQGLSYNILVSVNVPGDMNSSNNSMSVQVTNRIKPVGSNCSIPQVISQLPYYETGFSTDGFPNEYGTADACNSIYMSGSDFLFEYTPNRDEEILARLFNAQGAYNPVSGYLGMVGLFIIEGCPDDTNSVCIASVESFDGNPVIDQAFLTAGNTYYFLVSTSDPIGLNSYTDFDIEIKTMFSFDAGITEILEPVSAAGLSSGENVKVTLENFGRENLVGFSVGYSIDGLSSVMEEFTDTLFSETQMEYIFNIPADLSEPGKNYSIRSFTVVGGDGNALNDTAMKSVYHIPPMGSSCERPFEISQLPYESTRLCTYGFVNDYSEDDACQSSYLNRNDIVFEYIPLQNQQINVFISENSAGIGLFVIKNCPDNQYSVCVAEVEAESGSPKLLNVGLDKYNTYYIVVSSELNDSASFDIKVINSASGITETENFQYRVYPNPAGDILYFDFSSEQTDLTMRIRDVIGKEVLHFDHVRNANSIEELSSGIYFIEVTGPGVQWFEKILKK